jgi:pimeloyl-ACP methyl ester carboxylesterase
MIIDAEDSGEGPAVVLLHAGVADRRMWDHQAVTLTAAGLRVVRPDLRGYGATPAGTEPWDPVCDVVALVGSLGLHRFALVGASAGGSVALQLAARLPDRVDALVLLCPAAPDLVPSQALREIWREEVRLVEAGDMDGAVSLMVERFVGPDGDEQARALVADMQRRAYMLQLAADAAEEEGADTVELRAVTAPTLAVAGALDLPDFGQVARRVAEGVRDGRLVELPWAGHLPSLERPEETSRLVLDFVSRHVPGLSRS